VLLSAALALQSAYAQTGSKPGPMQSGVHTQKPAEAAPPTQAAPAQQQPMDVGALFATSCGWCHSGGGREAGKGPKLMGSALTDEELASRIRNGKTGQMPAFKGAFTDQQLRDIVAYIRGLKPAAEKAAK
jgi:mono/diheme cytochrome c family protein